MQEFLQAVINIAGEDLDQRNLKTSWRNIIKVLAVCCDCHSYENHVPNSEQNGKFLVDGQDVCRRDGDLLYSRFYDTATGKFTALAVEDFSSSDNY